MAKIIHYREDCIGCDACITEAPYRWEMDFEDGKSRLVDAVEKKGVFVCEISTEEYFENLRASESCPVKIIQVIK